MWTDVQLTQKNACSVLNKSYFHILRVCVLFMIYSKFKCSRINNWKKNSYSGPIPNNLSAKSTTVVLPIYTKFHQFRANRMNGSSRARVTLSQADKTICKIVEIKLSTSFVNHENLSIFFFFLNKRLSYFILNTNTEDTWSYLFSCWIFLIKWTTIVVQWRRYSVFYIVCFIVW